MRTIYPRILGLDVIPGAAETRRERRSFSRGDHGEELFLIDVGGLEYARLLEPFAMLWIHLALFRRQGLDFAFGLLRK
jgi:hypothetical protein